LVLPMFRSDPCAERGREVPDDDTNETNQKKTAPGHDWVNHDTLNRKNSEAKEECGGVDEGEG